jgi:hypothetical protein
MIYMSGISISKNTIYPWQLQRHKRTEFYFEMFLFPLACASSAHQSKENNVNSFRPILVFVVPWLSLSAPLSEIPAFFYFASSGVLKPQRVLQN